MSLNPQHRRRSFLGLDAAAAAGLALVVMVLFIAALQAFSNNRRDAEDRRMVRMAAEAELERLRIAGIDEFGQSRSPTLADANGVVLETLSMPGHGPWSGLTRITVLAQRVMPGHSARIELSAYLAIDSNGEEQSPVEDEP